MPKTTLKSVSYSTAKTTKPILILPLNLEDKDAATRSLKCTCADCMRQFDRTVDVPPAPPAPAQKQNIFSYTRISQERKETLDRTMHTATDLSCPYCGNSGDYIVVKPNETPTPDNIPKTLNHVILKRQACHHRTNIHKSPRRHRHADH
jgi:hypothetical protein